MKEKFIDTLTLTAVGGRGGHGAVSFRREKYVPRGGPDGGNGGKGGDVIIKGDRNMSTLLDLHYKREYVAGNGGNGKGRNCTGKNGADLTIRTPIGTIIFDLNNGAILADINDDAPFLLAKGGRGGRGNSSFASSTHRAPRTAEDGENGETRSIRLELKLIADVGIIGYPNAGKSTFISLVSAAISKVGDYPFTTTAPVLGVVKGNIEEKPFVIADMPGLIEGASAGAGLGLNFLRHIERTGLLLHFVDSSSESPMIDRYFAIRKELERYSEEVSAKPEVVVATKADSVVKENLEQLAEYARQHSKPFFTISSITTEGVTELLSWIRRYLMHSQ